MVSNALEYVESQAGGSIQGFHLSKVQPQKLLGLADVLRSHLHPNWQNLQIKTRPSWILATFSLALLDLYQMPNVTDLVTNGSLFVCWLFRRA